jgi:hypothetical protein
VECGANGELEADSRSLATGAGAGTWVLQWPGGITAGVNDLNGTLCMD